MGVRGRRDDGPRRLWVRRAILVLLLAGAGLTIPLTTVLFGQLARYERRTRLEVTPALVDDVERALGAAQVCRVVAVTVVRGEDDHDLLRLVIGVQEAPTPALADALAHAARSGLPSGVGVDVVLVGSAWTTNGG